MFCGMAMTSDSDDQPSETPVCIISKTSELEQTILNLTFDFENLKQKLQKREES